MEEQVELQSPVDLPQAEPSESADEQQRQTTATEGFVADLAEKMGEAPERLTVRRDTNNTLKRMKEGVVVRLHISRPRFSLKLSWEALGMKSGDRRAMSLDAESVAAQYLRLGNRSLLPKEYADPLANAESTARYALKRHSFQSHWGQFIPVTVYQEWKEDNAKRKKAFWQAVEAIRLNYDEIRQKVLDSYRVLAADAWGRLEAGHALAGQGKLSPSALAALRKQLHAEEGKEAFIDRYLAVIEAAFPSREALEAGFSYEEELEAIPLPSVLAQDLSQAEQAIAARAVSDAQAQAELERIQQERNLERERIRREREKIDLEREAQLRLLNKQERERQEQLLVQQRAQEDLIRLRRQAEEDRIRAQQQMEADVRANTRSTAQRLIEEFRRDAVAYLNEQLLIATGEVVESMDRSGGKLRGPVSRSLRQFIDRIERMNFMEDETIEARLERLRSSLPTPEQSERAAKGLEKLNVKPLERAVRAIHKEVEDVLLQMEISSPSRAEQRREALFDPEAIPSLDGRTRQARTGLAAKAVKATMRKTRTI